MEIAELFLKRHRMTAADIDIQMVVDVFTSEILLGLEGKESSLRMIQTYIEADNEFLMEVPVSAIYAGGTKFRMAKVSVRRNGRFDIKDLVWKCALFNLSNHRLTE